MFELQDRIAESVVAVIEPNVQLAEIERMKHKPVANFDAYDLLLRAQQLEYEFTEQSLAAQFDMRNKRWTLIPIMPRPWPWRLTAMRSGAIKAGGRIQARRSRLVGWTHVRWSLPRTMATSCGWRRIARHLSTDTQGAKELAYRSLQINPNSAVALAMAGWLEAISTTPTKALELFSVPTD